MKSLHPIACLLAAFFIGSWLILGHPMPASATAPAEGEEALFTNTTSPDALILIDLSGSMDWNPAGGDRKYGISSCAASTASCCTSTAAEENGFCSSSKTNCDTNCSRLAIAKRSLFDLLDDNDDNTINSSDEGSLGVRIGYMRFYDCNSDDTSDDYTSGCIKIPGSSSSRRYIGSKYSQIYCASNSSCTITSGSSSSYCINGESALGGTPLGSALRKAKVYLDAHKTADTAKDCRKKFVIFITDGADTFSCGGPGYECSDDGWNYSAQRYKQRREAVARAKAAADAGYKVFVVGFGAAMPTYLQNTLNWMAYYGGTDNPDVANAGSTSGYTSVAVGSCTADADAVTATCYDSGGAHNTTKFRASSNDPGYADLSGYAFLAGDADALAASLKSAMKIIQQANYSFSQSSVQSSRTSDENHLYEGSFEPLDNDSFWKGHLKKFKITNTEAEAAACTCYEADGTTIRPCVVGDVCGVDTSFGGNGDAGSALQTQNHYTRNIKTYKGGYLINFSRYVPLFSDCSIYPYCDGAINTGIENITTTDVGVTTAAERDAIIGYIRGNGDYMPAYAAEYPEKNASGQTWKLGDVFRSTPITVGTPSAFYYDARDANSEFNDHRTNHPRTSTNGYRLIVAGANDGQMHAFKTSNGSEAWSFLPPNLMSKLKNMTHTTHPTALGHQYFVDGPVTVADVWCVTPNASCGTGAAKADNSWATIMVFGLGRGATNHSWSSSQYCDSGISATYSASYPYYCGYHALNLTSSLAPTYLWRMSPNSTQAPYFGDSWSKLMTGRVRINDSSGNIIEKWVGFFGAGYNASDCSGGGTCDPRGKGVFIVDLYDGSILWSYTLGSTTTSTTNTGMKWSVPAQAAIVDTDNDGFIDLAYIGDMGGKIWRLKFCLSTDSYCSHTAGAGITKTWSGGMFFDSPSGNIRPIFTSPAVSKDAYGNLWVYWGTGDKVDPTAANAQEHFYGVKDNDRTTTWSGSDIDNLASANQTYDTSATDKVGWRIQLTGGGEKILADPTVFGGVVYFTTFTPASGNNPCEQGGTAGLYAVNYNTGAGALSEGARSMTIGSGIPSAPVISLKPGSSATPDLYVTTSGGGGTSASTQRVDINPVGVSNRTNMLYWRDRRLQ